MSFLAFGGIVMTSCGSCPDCVICSSPDEKKARVLKKINGPKSIVVLFRVCCITCQERKKTCTLYSVLIGYYCYSSHNKKVV
jgi:hypothetical protein